MPPPFCEHRGVGGARGRASRAHPFTVGPARPSPPDHQAPHSHLHQRHLGTTVRVQKETRVNARVQHLREATEMGEREPSLERPPHHQKQEGLVGWRWRGWQEGASEPGGEEGVHVWAVDSLLSSQVGGGAGGGREWPQAEPPRDGREVGFSTKINIFEFCLR